MQKQILFLIALAKFSLGYAQQGIEESDSIYTIVEAINSSDGGIYVIQPFELDRIVQHLDGANPIQSEQRSNNRVGYRIQIYSDNNIRTARANAESRKRQVEQFAPEIRGYLTFVSPYWRVRVGDFTHYVDAEAMLRELKAAFPQYAGDMRIVKENIHLGNN